MQQLASFIRKEFLHIFRDYRTLIILFGIPAVQIILFGYVVTMDIQDAKIAVLDPSHDDVTRRLIQKFDASENFSVSRELQSTDQIHDELKSGRVKMVLLFDADFDARLQRDKQASIGLIIDASEPNTARLLASFSNAIIAEFNGELAAASHMIISPEVRMAYNPTLKSSYMFVPGLMTLILLLTCTLMTSVTITREKEFGSLEVLLASPLRPLHIIIGKVAPYLIISFIDVLIILGMANIIFELPVKGSLALLLLESTLYIALSLSLGIFISTISKNMQQAIFMTLLGLLLPSVLLSGFIFPLENTPKIYQIISMALPPRWFIIIIKNIMLKGTGMQFVWRETLVLLGMTLFLIALSAKKFKLRLE